MDMLCYIFWDLHNMTTRICCVIVMFYLGLWTPADLIWIKWLFDAHSIETEIEFQTLLLATQDFREFLSVANLWTENFEFTRSGLKYLINSTKLDTKNFECEIERFHFGQQII